MLGKITWLLLGLVECSQRLLAGGDLHLMEIGHAEAHQPKLNWQLGSQQFERCRPNVLLGTHKPWQSHCPRLHLPIPTTIYECEEKAELNNAEGNKSRGEIPESRREVTRAWKAGRKTCSVSEQDSHIH